MHTTHLKNLANLNYCPISLRRELLQFHASFTPYTKPSIQHTGEENSSEFLTNLYNHADGVIFGEEHFDNISAGFLAGHMEHIAGLGVKTLFFEGLFHGLEKGMDGTRNERDSVYPEYQHMIDAAKKCGLNIVGIDAKGCKRGDGVTRDIFMNSYAQVVINKLPDRGKWVALTGMMHLNDSVFIDPITFERHLVRGLAEMTGGISVIIDAVNDNNERYIKANSEFLAAPAKMVKSDFIIGVPAYKKTQDKIITATVAELERDIEKHGWQLTHYDIDDFARKNGDDYIKAIIFAFSVKNKNMTELEAIKYQIKNRVATKKLLDINIDEKYREIVFCCQADALDELVENIRKIL